MNVIEVDQASKVAALRVGDQAADAFPRIYLDGDVAISTAGVRALAAALQEGGVLVAGVRGHYRLSTAPRSVRLYYEFRQRLAVFDDGIIGAGVYALSRDGRRRFHDWPDVLGDDQFIYRLFAAHERVCLDDHHTEVDPAPSLRTLIRRGNRQLDGLQIGLRKLRPPPAGFRRAVVRSSGSPRDLGALLVFVGVTVGVRLRARLSGHHQWS